jgi:anaerobic selenocysteine-containing dehydrogenase
MSPDILLARGDAVMRPEPGPNPNADRRYRICYDNDGVPVSVRSTVPFYEKGFTDEAGYEVLERYYLVFDFEAGGLMAEVTRTWTDAEFSGEYSYGFVELDRLEQEAREALLRLIGSGRLEEVRTKVLEAAREALEKIAQMTDLPSDAFQQADSLEKEVYEIFEQAVRQATAGVRQA